MRALTGALVLFGTALSLALLTGTSACSIETKASDVICVKDQTDICTNCEKPEGDTRPYRGQHTCASDGKSFGACMQCAPIDDADGKTPDGPGSDFKPLPPDDKSKGGPTTPIEQTCNKKLTLVAGKDDTSDQFVYAAVVLDGKFSVFSSSGAPMRSLGSFIISEGALMGVYRSKGSAVVTSTFRDGLWGAPVAVPGATTDMAPTIVSWGKKAKVIFHSADGRYNAIDWDPTTGWGAPIQIGTATTGVSGTSPPAAATVGAPGVKGSGIMLGYTDDDGGLYRQDWNGTNWRASPVKSTLVNALPMKTALVSMNGGAFDLVSLFTASGGYPYISTRTVKDNMSEWSNPLLVSDEATPIDGLNGVALSNGRALFVFRDSQKKGFYVMFDPAKDPKFTKPAPLFPGSNPALASTPVVVEDRCGAEAVLAYAESDGAVGVLRFSGDSWKGPFVVPGLSKMTYAMTAVLP